MARFEIKVAIEGDKDLEYILQIASDITLLCQSRDVTAIDVDTQELSENVG